MSTIGASGKAQSRRYTPEEKAQAVRMVFALRKEIGTSQGTVRRVAEQLGYGIESVRGWVKQAEIDAGVVPGVSSAEQARIRELEQENRELKRANAILKSSAAFFAAELCATRRRVCREVVRDRICWVVAAA
jgi:transposase